ncbi:hypothetical protein AZI87_16225 [Bdellovibrio bacteriovorus]|uniref:Glycine zipper domain-containing protein n=1 Tax=Bdellovibrio bacteriovorus TaxID=959 RepID=A0A162FZ13_BDEBC|nr:hypothetical protein [Bdellovibrio bacteriovorus]KYG62821.1 hypothetical protein AZI87_16225 [Bdellovibrio bacteriovorus]
MKSSLLLLLVCALLISACSTNQKSRLATTGIGIGVGAVIGAATAPDDERPELHAMYWGGILGVVTAVAANYYFNDEKDMEVMRLENEKMKAQLDFFQNGPATLLKDTKGPADKKYFQSGKARIKLYKIDQWVDEGPNKKYHRDQMIEILPLEKGDQ